MSKELLLTIRHKNTDISINSRILQAYVNVHEYMLTGLLETSNKQRNK